MSGMLVMNALVMYDHQSNTLWSQFLNRSIKCPLVNQDLELAPAVQTSCQEWLNLHPDTLVMDKGGSYGKDVYDGYYSGGPSGIIEEANQVPCLPKKDLVLGITVSGIAKAYSFSAIVEERVNNDHLAETEALVTFDPTSESRAAFVRNIGNRVLNFEREWVRDGVALM